MELLFAMIAILVTGVAIVGVMVSVIAIDEAHERDAFRFAVIGFACFLSALISSGFALYWMARAVAVAVR